MAFLRDPLTPADKCVAINHANTRAHMFFYKHAECLAKAKPHQGCSPAVNNPLLLTVRSTDIKIPKHNPHGNICVIRGKKKNLTGQNLDHVKLSSNHFRLEIQRLLISIFIFPTQVHCARACMGRKQTGKWVF